MHYSSIFEAPPSPDRLGGVKYIEGSRVAKLDIRGVAVDLFQSNDRVSGKERTVHREVGSIDEFG